MPLYNPENTPQQNLSVLASNPYPGRGLVIGDTGGEAVIGYFITGRSTGSRNRVLVSQNEIVSTAVADPNLETGDPELTIYDAVREVDDYNVVSNGNQTDTLVRHIRSLKTPEDALAVTDFEHDDNSTPRITAYNHFDTDEGEPLFGISVIRRNTRDGRTIRSLWTDKSPELEFVNDSDAPYSYAVHTYLGDGKPLPSFDEAPFTLPVQNNPEAMADMLWERLDRQNRVAVAAKYIDLAGHARIFIINAFDENGGRVLSH